MIDFALSRYTFLVTYSTSLEHADRMWDVGRRGALMPSSDDGSFDVWLARG